jgi:site-specific recombinase XerD
MTNPTTVEPIALAGTLPEFLRYVRQIRRLSPNTEIAYRGDLRQFLRWAEGQELGLQTESLAPSLALRFIGDLPQLAPNSVRRKVNSLSAWAEFLIRTGRLQTNPFRQLPLPRRRQHERRFPSETEGQALLAAPRTPLERLFVSLLLGAGLRRSEVIGLDLADLSPDQTEEHVRGKGEVERTVPLPPYTQHALQTYLASRGRDSGPLLLSRVGSRMGPTALRRLFARLLRRAGLQGRGFSLHSCRQSYAVMLLHAGVDLYLIKDLLGYGDISVTAKYLHCDTTTRHAAVARLDLLCGGGDPS